jgi:hypothetical protein
MKDAQKPDHVSLTTLVNRLREGRFVIPDFQREFEWEPWDISELMRSIFLDYYIGSLLLWKGKKENFIALACEPIYGYLGDDKPEHIVLDGQQRLTAMHYAFVAPDVPAPKRKNRFLYFIRVDRLMNEDYEEAFHYDWKKTTESLLENDEAQFERHLFPLAVIGKPRFALPNWIQGYERYWSHRESSAAAAGDVEGGNLARKNVKNALAFGDYLQELTEEYQIAYIELDSDLELDKVCDIFTQINSRGIRLDVFDLINALLKPKGLQLKHLWRQAKSELEFVETERMNVYILQVMSILLQAYCSPKYLYYLLPGQEKKVREPDGSLRKEVLIPDIRDFETRWHSAVDAISRAIEVLRHPQEYGAISSQYLPYVSILPAFAALREQAQSIPSNLQLGARKKLRQWYWASVFTNRYSGAVESTTARDFLDVRSWFEDDEIEPSLISDFKARFRSLDFRKEIRRGTSVYNGVFDLLVIRGAQDWTTGDAPRYGDLDDHHIVPKSWGSAVLTDGAIDSILNRTPLTSYTNRNVIKDRLPNEYLPGLAEAAGESQVRSIFESHCISPLAFDILLRDPFTADDFEDFIAERQRTLLEAIEDLLIEERVEIPPQLRELNDNVEKIELALRNLINQRLEGDPTKLPGHVLQNADQRLQGARRKDPGLHTVENDRLAKLLEFSDLRELQDTIANKALWPLFSQRFVNKDALRARFGQLAELRNGIRHSRAVDEVTRKEGEAAILWFEKVLAASIG